MNETEKQTFGRVIEPAAQILGLCLLSDNPDQNLPAALVHLERAYAGALELVRQKAAQFAPPSKIVVPQ